MPKTIFQEIIFTAVMATAMVYGMVVYNIMLATGQVSGTAFLAAVHELPIMAPIAFILEFLVVGKLAKMIAFRFVDPRSASPLKITCTISFCICMIMCPLMSLIATVLFNEPSLATWLRAWGLNIAVAISYQLLVCGPAVRFAFSRVFAPKKSMELSK